MTGILVRHGLNTTKKKKACPGTIFGSGFFARKMTPARFRRPRHDLPDPGFSEIWRPRYGREPNIDPSARAGSGQMDAAPRDTFIFHTFANDRSRYYLTETPARFGRDPGTMLETPTRFAGSWIFAVPETPARSRPRHAFFFYSRSTIIFARSDGSLQISSFGVSPALGSAMNTKL